MEVVCCPTESNVFYGGEVSGCRALKRLDLKTKLKYRYSHCNIFGDLKCKASTYSLRRLKKNTEYCFSSGSQGISKGGNLWMRRYSSNGHSGRICKISKHLGLSQPQDNEPVAHATGGCGDGEVYEAVENEVSLEAVASKEISKGEVAEPPGLNELRDLLRKALKDLEVARLNRKLYEGKAQQISEAAIALKDDAENALNDLNGILFSIQEIEKEEAIAKEGVQKATMALSLAEARLQVAMKTAQEKHESAKDCKVSDSAYESRDISSDQEMLLAAQKDVEACQFEHENCEEELRRLQRRKEELNKEMDRLNAVEAQAQLAEEEVADIMLLAEQAVSYELQAAQCVNDAEIALRRVEKNPALSSIDTPDSTLEATISEYLISFENAADEDWKGIDKDSFLPEPLLERQLEELRVSNHSEKVETQLSGDQVKEKESEQELQKESARNHSPFTTPRSFIKKSSWFFSACFFSFSADEEKFMPAPAFRRILEAAKKQLPKLIFGSLLVGAGITLYVNQRERVGQLCQQLQITSSGDGDSTTAKPLARQMRQLSVKMKKIVDMLPHQEIKEEEAFLCDVLWLLLASVIFVPIFRKLPGGSPILGYLVAGILIGPYGISIIRNVHETKAVAEFGVVFLLFNIGLELSIERLSSMKKYVFGLGSAQVLATAVALGLLCHYVAGLSGPAALVTGSGLALSSTAVVLQVLQERGESTSRHGRATFSVLLFQDLAVVVLLILIPLLSPSSSKGGVGFHAIAEALGLAAVKAFAAISVIIAGGRVLLRPIYNEIAAEDTDSYIFSATTLLVVLGTSLFTARAGLSMALGAFLAGLLLAETEFFLQIESDISLFRALLLGLFFMTVGMSIDPKSLVSNFSVVTGSVGLLIVGKTILVALVGRLYDLSMVSAVRVGLLLGPGGEFAFVAFGEAVNQGIISAELSSLLFLVVGISMAITPWLAAGGQLIASWFELQDVRNLLPVETETDDLQDHVIVCGFGRVGQIIAQILSSHLIPFVALDVRGDRVALGRSMELPVYFGDAGSREVLRKIGAERACAAAITLDSAGSNYRTLWALSKHFPNVKTFVRAHDVAHGVNLEKAGATAVVPEILEPSLELAAAVLSQTKFPKSEIYAAINECRSGHLSKLRAQSEAHGYSFGYGFPRVKPISQPSDTSSEDKQSSPGTRPE